MAAFRYQEAQPDHETRKAVREDSIESDFLGKLQGLKYEQSMDLNEPFLTALELFQHIKGDDL